MRLIKIFKISDFTMARLIKKISNRFYNGKTRQILKYILLHLYGETHQNSEISDFTMVRLIKILKSQILQ